VARPAAVFFDVDFTLIHPGPRFQGTGYQATCARYGVTVDPARFEAAVTGAAPLLDSADLRYDAGLFVAFTSGIIHGMGGAGAGVEAAAREICEDWAEHRHFSLYDEVPGVLRGLHRTGIRLGLISNSDRSLTSFGSHFELDGLIAVTVSSAEHGFMKPHPQIFQAALDRMQVRADEAVMVGDSVAHDVAGARLVGMRAILLARGGGPAAAGADVDVIRSLDELTALLDRECSTPAASRRDGRRGRAGAHGTRSGRRRPGS
jgi:HAD superfamily hydrolase (TIGR01662 family)